jgi:hypothetical protein
VDHIISKKHGGQTSPENLAYACLLCNRCKGSDVSSVSRETGQLTPLFNPRTERWSTHFALETDGITIHGLSDIGRVTARLLAFNTPERLLQRGVLRRAGKYPGPVGLRRMLASD